MDPRLDWSDRPTCKCGRPCKRCAKYSVKTGKPRWRKHCSQCFKAMAKPYGKKAHLAYRKSTCEDCGFVPVHICQLDVDHVDGDRTNNDPSNLRTRCANCHRLKTFLNRDIALAWRKPKGETAAPLNVGAPP